MIGKVRSTLILGCLALGGFGCSGFSAPLADIESVERARFSAMTHQDVKALQPMLAEIFSIARLNQVVPIFQTTREAVAKLAPDALAQFDAD